MRLYESFSNGTTSSETTLELDGRQKLPMRDRPCVRRQARRLHSSLFAVSFIVGCPRMSITGAKRLCRARRRLTLSEMQSTTSLYDWWREWSSTPATPAHLIGKAWVEGYLDTPRASLGGVTPRSLLGTKEGRSLVASQLQSMSGGPTGEVGALSPTVLTPVTSVQRWAHPLQRTAQALPGDSSYVTGLGAVILPKRMAALPRRSSRQ